MRAGDAARRRLLLGIALAGAGLGRPLATRAASAASHPEPSARLGTHGMVLFGGIEGLYTSHMPMFHAPHDVQAIFRVHVGDASLDARLRHALALATGPWSIEPERFDLDRAAPGAADPLTGWRAQVFEGHFERGGALRHRDVPFVVERTPLFERLDPRLRQASRQEFLCLGEGREHFLVKRLDQRPDVDLIGRFRTAGAVAVRGLVRTTGASHDGPADAHLRPALERAGAAKVEGGGVHWLYRETADLAG